VANFIGVNWFGHPSPARILGWRAGCAGDPARDARARPGRIVNVGSTSIGEPIPGLNLSDAHRVAAVGFLKALSREVADDGITVDTVATGRFATDRIASNCGSMEEVEQAARGQVPAGRLGPPPEEYGDLVAFRCSERAAHLSGAVVPLDGGMLDSAF
jgi:3-oxoacyl-[acyl-carrier protein] reductase